ncbi:hypothetical protein CCZ01_07765 [Helicobacter monodelphidis]|uniref:NAD(+)/NADH kinase n=1 Tax=Helicobacter sp. 15-1451 TaxID=2004995 RepID=UPI000DCB30E9|nr:NAD(+)/NADH kinase [Helicobacter sp. 15-1451]RAX56941.1 hypothetical protein CCZ01_07765 [Helicobacter sp. 15-1451]
MKKQIQYVGIILRPNMPSLKEYFNTIKAIFLHYQLTPLLDMASAKMIQSPDGVDFNQLLKKADLLLAIGGDGTLLALIRRSYGYNIPVAGVNMGRLGFLAEISRDNIQQLCESIVNQRYTLQETLTLEGNLDWHTDSPLIMETVGINYGSTSCIHNPLQKASLFAFNEFTLMRSDTFGIIYPKISVINPQTAEKNTFNSFGGDGFIVSTPRGSTAYNISAGGPVVHPFSDNIILTPICAHSLTQRPLVLSSDFTLCIELQEPCAANLIVDGQRKLKFSFGDKLIIHKAKHSTTMLHTYQYDYFTILREKLHWG